MGHAVQDALRAYSCFESAKCKGAQGCSATFVRETGDCQTERRETRARPDPRLTADDFWKISN